MQIRLGHTVYIVHPFARLPDFRDKFIDNFDLGWINALLIVNLISSSTPSGAPLYQV